MIYNSGKRVTCNIYEICIIRICVLCHIYDIQYILYI